MTLKHLFSQGLIILALFFGLNLHSVTPAHAIPSNYIVTGDVAGTFSADLSAPISGFITWDLTTPVATFSIRRGQYSQT
jgi:hypothetical protein